MNDVDTCVVDHAVREPAVLGGDGEAPVRSPVDREHEDRVWAAPRLAAVAAVISLLVVTWVVDAAQTMPLARVWLGGAAERVP